jgi:hypothetical protein
VHAPDFIFHALGWLWPTLGLTLLTLLAHRLSRRCAPRRGWGFTGLALLTVGLLVQAGTAWALRWPDGSMAAYAVLLLALALTQTLLFKRKAGLG